MKKTGILYISLAFALFISNLSQAQNSGYMGKKLMLSAAVEANTNQLFMGDLRSPKSSPIKYWLDLKNNFSAEYAISRRGMIGVQVAFNKLQHVAEAEIYPEFSVQNRLEDLEFQFKVMRLGLSYKFFSKNSIAPMGSYGEFEAGMYKVDFLDNIGHSGEKNKVINNYKDYYVGYGFGRQQLIFRNVFLNVGANVKFSMLMAKGVADDDKEFFKKPNGDNVILTYNPGYQMISSFILNGKIGLGVMLF